MALTSTNRDAKTCRQQGRAGKTLPKARLDRSFRALADIDVVMSLVMSSPNSVRARALQFAARRRADREQVAKKGVRPGSDHVCRAKSTSSQRSCGRSSTGGRPEPPASRLMRSQSAWERRRLSARSGRFQAYVVRRGAWRQPCADRSREQRRAIAHDPPRLSPGAALEADRRDWGQIAHRDPEAA